MRWMITAVFVGLIGSVALAQDAGVSLRPKFVEGRTTQYEMWSKRESKTTISANDRQREISSTIESTGMVTWRCDSVGEDGSVTCTMTYQKLTLKVTGPDGAEKTASTETGTADEGLQPLLDMLNAYVDKPIVFTISAKGKIENVKGGEAIRNDIEGEDRGPKDRDLEETAKELIGFEGVPAKVTKGDTWSDIITIPHETGEFNVNMAFSYEGIETIEGIDIAQVSATGGMTLDVDESKLPTEGPQPEIRLTEGLRELQALFDIKRGQLVGSNVRRKSTIEVTVSPIPQ
ncbi:MAG: DUF6263 family protein, partial [Rhodospirillales bacterium]|nr:DUF6263 family protein [Rhodospirillales bacterium]